MAVDSTVYDVRHLSIPSYSLEESEWGECCVRRNGSLPARDRFFGFVLAVRLRRLDLFVWQEAVKANSIGVDCPFR